MLNFFIVFYFSPLFALDHFENRPLSTNSRISMIIFKTNSSKNVPDANACMGKTVCQIGWYSSILYHTLTSSIAYAMSKITLIKKSEISCINQLVPTWQWSGWVFTVSRSKQRRRWQSCNQAEWDSSWVRRTELEVNLQWWRGGAHQRNDCNWWCLFDGLRSWVCCPSRWMTQSL